MLIKAVLEYFRYQPPNLAISTLYWKAWLLLLVVAAFNPQKIGEVFRALQFSMQKPQNTAS